MTLPQQSKLPEKPLPIVIIEAGGIIKEAHLHAYNMAGFRVSGIYNKTKSKAEALKNDFDIVEDVYDAMRLVEAAYISSEQGGVKIFSVK